MRSSRLYPLIALLVLLALACTCSTGIGPLVTVGVTEAPQGFDPLPVEPASPAPPPVPTPTPTLPPVAPGVMDQLAATILPVRDPLDLACRLQGVCNLPTTFGAGLPRVEGERQTFWAIDHGSDLPFQLTATLRVVGEHAYFWVDDRVAYDEADLRRLAQTFDESIYPTNREYFGREWSPGVDNDPRLYVLYARGVGDFVVGYFSSDDEYSPLAQEYSNAHELFIIHSRFADFADEDASTLAHEFQHMISWYVDRNEDTWLDEGLSVMAQVVNGYPNGYDWAYIANPDLPLTGWNDEGGSNTAHYGGSFLFLNYLYDRFGPPIIRAIAAEPQNGLPSIDAALAAQGSPLRAEDVFADWLAANYLNDASLADGRYAYADYPEAQQVRPDPLGFCPLERSDSVNQFGADYWRLTCSGEHTLEFRGPGAVRLVPADPSSGEYAFWSNRGNESDITLTRSFDLTGVSAPIELRYRVWYDLEEDYDYVYLAASTDGQSWQLLSTPAGTPDDPTGSSLGWGYTGRSEGWRDERVDLSRFAGQVVQLRFEYVTDSSLTGEGLLLDDVAIPALGYQSDFENDDGGWQAAGFVRLRNSLPQAYILMLVLETAAGTQVVPLPVDESGYAATRLSLATGDQAVLIVAAATRYTLQPVDYTLTVR